MDIISHTLTGIAVGTLSAALFIRSWKSKVAIIFAGVVGRAPPDFDAISLWSKFNSTIGLLVGLSHSGKAICFEKFWYYHHGASHSIIAPIVFILPLT
jgi:inner membrane protein